VPGWDYDSPLGAGVLHEDYVFLTRSHTHAATDAIWLVKCYRPDRHRVQYYKIEPGEKVGLVTVQCWALDGDHTHVQVTYRYTALGEGGRRFVEELSTGAYGKMIDEWAARLHAHLGLTS
jgi:hypothetical protein